jgi:P4 family phage/plasmid primase-like protien
MPDTAKVKKEPKLITQDLMLSYAYEILKGNGGGQYVYCLEEDDFYIYEGGVWHKIADKEILAKVSKAIPKITTLILAQRKQILENYKLISFKKLDEFNRFPFLNLQNYMIDPLGNNVLKHEDRYFSTTQLWIKTLNEILENDQKRILLLQEFFGYCLTPDIKHKKALLLLGESDTGKSTILFTLRDLVGIKNCSSVPLKYLSNPQYTPMMVNKLVNIDADVAKDAANYEAEFKIITTGEPIACNQKFIETFEFLPYCKIVLAANIFPKISDHSSAFYKRLVLIPLDRIFEEQEKNRLLNIQLKEELPGILNWSIQGLSRLTQRGMFEQHDFMKNAVQELEDENNPVNGFFKDHVEIDVSDGVYIEKAELYKKYKEWSGDKEEYKLSNTVFARCVYKKYFKVTPKSARLNDGKRAWIWRNLKYVVFKSEHQPDKGWQE